MEELLEWKRPLVRRIWLTLVTASALAAPSFAQQDPPKEPPKEQINLQQPPPPPAQEAPKAPEFVPPEKVFLPGATSIAVVLDTPLSTRITKKGMEAVFLTSQSVQLGEGIQLPPDTRILATIVEAKKPGAFGRPGAMKIKIERIEVEGQTAPLVGRLEGVDANAGKVKSDSSRTADLYRLATWTLSGTLIGAQSGGKGALIGAGAGAAVALIIGMSRKGPDLYLEPGTPFSVVVDDAVELNGADVYAAQLKYAQTHHSRSEEEMLDSMSDPNRPQLKHRPKPPTL